MPSRFSNIFSLSYINIIIIVMFVFSFSFVVYFGFSSSFSYTLLIIVIDCSLEKYCETTWKKCDKVVFNICGVSYICNGRHLPNELVTLGASLSKKRLCKLISNSFNKFQKISMTLSMSLKMLCHMPLQMQWNFLLILVECRYL